MPKPTVDISELNARVEGAVENRQALDRAERDVREAQPFLTEDQFSGLMGNITQYRWDIEIAENPAEQAALRGEEPPPVQGVGGGFVVYDAEDAEADREDGLV